MEKEIKIDVVLPQWRNTKLVEAAIIDDILPPSTDDPEGYSSKWKLKLRMGEHLYYSLMVEDGFIKDKEEAEVMKGGYFVRDAMGKTRWVEREYFESEHVRIASVPTVESAPVGATFDFSEALLLLRMGNRLRRRDWNGPGQFVWFRRGWTELSAEGATTKYSGCFYLRNAQGKSVCGWVPSTGDLISDQWEVAND
jgi:hypothetical protein